MDADSLKKELMDLQQHEAFLDQEIASLSAKNEKELLHQYNDIKDAAQVVMGALADLERVTLLEMHKRFNMEPTNKTME